MQLLVSVASAADASEAMAGGADIIDTKDPSAGPLFVIGSDLAMLRIHAEVSETDVGELRVDQQASFSVPAHPNRSFDAKIERIGLDARRSAVAVRDAALRFRPEGTEPAAARSRVFRLDGTRLVEVRVTAGLSNGALTAVTPHPPGALEPGAELAIGVLSGPEESDSGPGIRLGNR